MAEDLAVLQRQRDAKYQEILEAVATELKLGKFATLPAADQERVEVQAETVVEQWMEESEPAPRQPKSPLEQLFADYAAIAMKIPETEEGEDDDKK